jgi:hypothetical protein
MAEYVYDEVQIVPAGGACMLQDSIPCQKGYVYHEDETGIFILRGIVNNSCAKFATYQIVFNGNIAVPTGGTAGAIAVGITVNGELRPTSKAIVTPAAVEEFNNVTSTCIIKVPRGCCLNVAVRSVSGVAADGTPAPVIEVQNANLVINRIA